MKLQENEHILKVFHHHSFFFIFRGIMVWLASIPFFFMVYVISFFVSFHVYANAYFAVAVIFSIIHLYDFLIFYMDALVITNKRVVHLDWLHLFKYVETQAMLDDIQNISTQENGLLSRFKFFDFGKFHLETASTKTTLVFDQAPDPEGIKYFLYNLSRANSTVNQTQEINRQYSTLNDDKSFVGKSQSEKVEKVV